MAGASDEITQDLDFMRWGVKETCEYLQRQGLTEWTDTFKKHGITGDGLRYLTEERLQKMDISPLGVRFLILHSIKKLWQIATEHKVFNDPIHGHIKIHPLLVKIIDTPQFQRLRDIKQLGAGYYVFPGASHNRFEHSIGVGHLAGRLVQALNERQPELKITVRDILCVQIAGLCHDLGHGPFSHMFDDMFIPKARPELEWKHETGSVAMFYYLVEVNNLRPVMIEHKLELPEDLVFIKELIEGPKIDHPENGWPYQGRPKEKSFLYEIVSNQRNGIDVDKFDYFARDCYYLGIQNNFDYHRFLKFARVCEVDGVKQICTRDKEVGNLYDMFHTRNCLHRRAYQHKVVNIIETMITEAFLEADKSLKISKAVDDMETYTKLTDKVFTEILYSARPELAPARDIIRKIVNRQLYKCVGQIYMEHMAEVTEEMRLQWAGEIARARPQYSFLNAVILRPEDLIVKVIKMDYGQGDNDPIRSIRFYNRRDLNKAFLIPRHQVSTFTPIHFQEKLIQVYCKKTDDNSVEAAIERVEEWHRPRMRTLKSRKRLRK